VAQAGVELVAKRCVGEQPFGDEVPHSAAYGASLALTVGSDREPIIA